MIVWKSILLGLLQGVTEFLPISSSGHLVILKSLLNVRYPGISFEVFVHVATLLAILYVFRARVASITRAILRPRAPAAKENLNLLYLILLANLPSAVVGLTLRQKVEQMFERPDVVGIALLLTGFYVFATRFARGTDRELRVLDALLIGVAQAAALLPGVSRSGATISTALVLGLGREKSAEFCFLVAVPAILGAAVLEMGHLLEGAQDVQVLGYSAGFLAAFISGFAAIKLVLLVLRVRRFADFAYYCWAVGVFVLLWTMS
ncbi:MAG: hypothetical protein AMJ46_06820 [Latescibacteria bacterium DG_63]|nr:MAG: hypothetical protein AMJ46_06820 [Latescibacteria bacterium DG_63]